MPIIDKDILSVTQFLSNSNLSIPPFQRPYKWSVRNVVQLLDDIERFKETPSYRIGTVVIFQEMGKDECQIVDGQQRTLTFLLMLKAILALRVNTMQSSSLQDDLKKLNDLVFRPVFNNDVTRQNIQANYREIQRRIATVGEGFIAFFLEKCEVTYFVIDDISEAFQFFDSQNARGKDLEPHDLLKAYHLRELYETPVKPGESELSKMVRDWEDMKTKTLSALFADFMFRVRGWSNGRSSRYFTKREVWMFKGINIESGQTYPYAQLYKISTEYLKAESGQKFPFQLDQVIINGKYFFEMIRHYHKLSGDLQAGLSGLDQPAQKIIYALNNYGERNRTGDKYIRMLFDCALLHYIDRFGTEALSGAVKKIFIWAYSLRLNYQILQLATVDNYVLRETNLFRKIRNAVRHDSITAMELPLVSKEFKCTNTKDIKDLFQQMRYVSN